MCKDCENCKYKEKVIDEYGYDIFEEEEIDIDEWREKEFGTKDPTGSNQEPKRNTWGIIWYCIVIIWILSGLLWTCTNRSFIW
jgi:hypothetical protein